MARIKICGIRRQLDIDYANELLPDYIGFILSEGFRRSIDDELAVKLKSKLDSRIKAVGVFVNDGTDRINDLVKNKTIDIVQLHGNETPEYCSKIEAPVIKALKPEDFCKAAEYEPYVDYLLFDSGTGTGETFNWSKIPKTDKPFFLAGGIGINNIREALNEINPYCIDLSSSVETDGYKDYNKIKQIMECVR